MKRIILIALSIISLHFSSCSSQYEKSLITENPTIAQIDPDVTNTRGFFLTAIPVTTSSTVTVDYTAVKPFSATTDIGTNITCHHILQYLWSSKNNTF